MEISLLNDRESLTEEFAGLMRETSPNIHGFGIGNKIVSGVETDELSLTYFVHKKRPLSVIDDRDLIPEYVYLQGQKLKTDVVERGFAEFLVTCNNFDATPTPFNVAEHRRAHRPLIGGIHVLNMYTNAFLDGNGGTNQNQIFNRFGGTLGGLVVDNDTNTVVGLTNAHVIVKDYTYAHNRSLAKEIYNIYDNVAVQRWTIQGNVWASNGTFISGYDQVVLQDSTNSVVTTGTAVIGRPKKYTPSAASTPTCYVMNTVDAAICTLGSSSLLTSGVSNLQLGILPANVTNVPFATTQEINSCLNAVAISAGARTGPKNESCGLKITRVGVTVSIGPLKVQSQGSTVDLYYSDLIEVDYADGQGMAVAGGDSGSFLLAKFGSVFKVVGLIFAGTISSTRAIGYACRIDNVQKALNISQWDGRPLGVDTMKKGTIVVAPKDFKGDYFDFNGVTFYQAGIGSANNNIYPTGSQEYWDNINNRLACSGDNPFCTPVVGQGLVGYKVETIYVHNQGDPSDAVCYPPERILPPCFVGDGLLEFNTFHAESVFINEPPFPCRISLESGIINPGPDSIDFKLTYESGPGHTPNKQWLFFEEAPLPAGYNPSTAILKSGLSGSIGSGGSGFFFHIVPQPDPTSSIKIDDGERCFIYARSKSGKNYPLSINGNEFFLSKEAVSELINDNSQFELKNKNEEVSLTSAISCAINPGGCCEPRDSSAGRMGINYYTKKIYAIENLAISNGAILKTCGLCPPSGPVCIEDPNVCPGVTINNEAVAGLNNSVIARVVGTPTTPGTYTTKIVFTGTYGGGGPGNGGGIQEVWTLTIVVQSLGGGGGGGPTVPCGPNDLISGWYDASGSFLIFTSGSGQGPGGDNVGVDNPCGGGHVCNRADFDIKMKTELSPSGYTVLSGMLNNAGTRDNGPGPFPYNGQYDRYSSRIITSDDNFILFGFSGVNTGSNTGIPLSFSISIVPSPGNTNPHLGVTWVRILNECNEVVYSCCLGEGGGTTAPPGWQPPPYSPNSFNLKELIDNFDILKLNQDSNTIYL